MSSIITHAVEFNAAHVIRAKSRLGGVAVRTPLLSSRQLDDLLGVRAFYKAELLQRTNSFKFRGAYSHVAALSGPELERGVVAASSGNHAQALALAARLLNTKATVVIPDDCPNTKVSAILAEGADIVRYNRKADDRDQIVSEIASLSGSEIVPSSNAYSVMAGNGTVALEMLEDNPGLDTLFVPLGGGGLAAGCAAISKAINPHIRVIGVEPEGANDTYLSLKEGIQISVPQINTIADGLRHHSPSALPLEVNRKLLDDVILVSDDEIAEAMRLAFRFLKVAPEPSGACAMAALMRMSPSRSFHQFGVVLTGGNVDWATFRALADKSYNKLTS